MNCTCLSEAQSELASIYSKRLGTPATAECQNKAIQLIGNKLVSAHTTSFKIVADANGYKKGKLVPLTSNFCPVCGKDARSDHAEATEQVGSTELKKCYATDDSDFNFTEFGDLLDAIASEGPLEVGTIYYEADFRPVTVSDVVDVNRVIEDIDERLYDIAGESAEDGLNVSDEAVQELKSFLAQWATKHSDLKRYYKIVGKSREMKITEEDITDQGTPA